MHGVARIRFCDGALVMPARSGYDRELLFEEAEFYARRHGQVTLELDDRAMSITVIKGSTGRSCSACGARAARLAFTLGGRLLCRLCARTVRR
jgi:hypothetical protein